MYSLSVHAIEWRIQCKYEIDNTIDILTCNQQDKPGFHLKIDASKIDIKKNENSHRYSYIAR